MSIRRFHVDTKLDGKSSVTVEIKPTAGGTDAVVSVRPKGKRTVYTGMLSDAVQFIAARHAKALAAQAGIAVPQSRKLRRS